MSNTPEAAKKLIIDIQSPISINGAVEVTTGNAEKSKCLKNLNTLFELKQWYEFNEELKNAIRDYPDEWRVWLFRFKYNMLVDRNVLRKCDGSYIKLLFKYMNFEDDIIKAKQVCPDNQIADLEKMYIEIFDELILEIKNQSLIILYHDAKEFLTISYAFENKKWIDYMQTYIEDCEKAITTIKSELFEYKKRTICLKIYDFTFSFSGENIENALYFDGHSIGKTEFRTGYETLSAEYGYYLTAEQFINCIKEQNPIGCYIATCVYGSYDCPEVWRLRRFRDNQLSNTWYGKTFISIYYTISPTLVKWFGETVWFKKIWKVVIDRIVLKLKDKGFEETPYKDK